MLSKLYVMLFIKLTRKCAALKHAFLITVAFSESTGLCVAGYNKELLLGLCTDGQRWPQTLSSLHSLPLTNRPLTVRHAESQWMSKAPFSPE